MRKKMSTDWFEQLDYRISRFMNSLGITALRISMGIIFIWFGILKPFGMSAAAPLVLKTVNWMPFLSPEMWLSIIGVWEVAIGICFLYRPFLRIAIALLALQMGGTMLPLFILPHVTFQAGHIPYAPTIEGQYIIKNLLIISAALVIGGTVRKRKLENQSSR
jgi:uncharacterized membrane protein YkgB